MSIACFSVQESADRPQFQSRDVCPEGIVFVLLVKCFRLTVLPLIDPCSPSARVAYTKVEQQLKSRGLPYEHFNPLDNPFPELSHIQSSLARSIPALCVRSSDILSGAPAAEAAMPNIRVIPLNWWSERKAQVRFRCQHIVRVTDRQVTGCNLR